MYAMEKTAELIPGTSNLPESTKNSHTIVAPAVDIFENDKEFLIVADMPGVGPDGLNIHFDSSDLSIEGRQLPSSGSRSEVLPLSFERMFHMPLTVHADKITAKINRGVLKVHLEKSEKAKAKKIAVTID
jgi:HSP20 family molecular chaperone IbpA